MESDRETNNTSEGNGDFIGIKECQKDKKATTALQAFTMAQIINYFIEAVAGDNEKSKDFKSLRESSYQMFKEGHIQKIMLMSGYKTVIIKCDCLPEMRKDRVYKIIMRINDGSGEIQFSKCGCVAGKGPRASCKHIASVCYALENFSRVFLDEPEHLACTDLLQKWNQPRKRRLSPKKISELDFAIESHNNKKKTRGLQGRKPEEIVGQITDTDLRAVRNLKTKLELFRTENVKVKLSIFPVLSQDQGCSASGPVSSSARESSKCTTTTSTSTTTNSNNINCNFSANSSVTDNIIHQRVLVLQEGLNKTADERIDIFRKTQAQSQCSLWFEERRGRITGSVCGRIINRNCNIYPKSIIENVLKISRNKTAAMVMGQEQEDRILARYINHKRENGHSDISVEKAGFLIGKRLAGCITRCSG